jgi:hypothetical protein
MTSRRQVRVSIRGLVRVRLRPRTVQGPVLYLAPSLGVPFHLRVALHTPPVEPHTTSVPSPSIWAVYIQWLSTVGSRVSASCPALYRSTASRTVPEAPA